jgi:hypothetical protein
LWIVWKWTNLPSPTIFCKLYNYNIIQYFTWQNLFDLETLHTHPGRKILNYLHVLTKCNGIH